ncbi:MAG: Fe-S cluster assembly protein SufD [Pseudomonadota bacterium]
MPIRHFDPAPGYAELFQAMRGALPGPADLRQESFERFAELGFPNLRAEAWKYTNLKPVAELAPSAPRPASLTVQDVADVFIGGDDVHRLVFVNGHLAKDLSSPVPVPAGLSITTLAEGLAVDPALLAEPQTDRALTALNAALAEGGAVIEVAAGTDVQPLVQLVFVTVGDGTTLTNVRNRVVLGAGARLRMAETHLAIGDGGVANIVNTITVGEGGSLDVDKLELGVGTSTLLAHTRARLARQARFSKTTVCVGGGLVRNETHAHLDGSEADLHLNGVYAPAAGEHVDTAIRVDHRAPNCESNQFYKGILAAGGHGVFAGKIFVDQVAQQTNAYQQNDNLMLARDAELDTKPELEIYADDVKCSHGATVGELDEASLFYLRSRGLDQAKARSLLTFAFAGEIIEKLVHEDSQHQARRALLGRLPGGHDLMELV